MRRLLPLHFGLIGHPLGHSLSPALHNWVYREIGIDASYQAWPTPSGKLAEFMRCVRERPLHGVSVTIPHKQAVMEFTDTLANLAKQTGAVNTLVWEEGRLAGHNTDVAGFLTPLKIWGVMPETALVLGAGGASRAVLSGLSALVPRPRLYLTARNFLQAEKLSQEFPVLPLAWEERTTVQVELVVNTTPMGMNGNAAAMKTPLEADDFSIIRSGAVSPLAYELVYSPLNTPFLLAARTAGWATQDGLDMLIAQALEQIKLWTGRMDLPAQESIRQMLCSQNLIK